MTRLELATKAVELINASNSRLNAYVVNKNGVVKVKCQVGKHTCEIDFPSKAKPEIEDGSYSKLTVVKSARDAISDMPESAD